MKRNMNYGRQVTEEFQRKVLAEILEQCTEKQRDVHRRMYPNGVAAEDLPWAITQARNTVLKNGAASEGTA